MSVHRLVFSALRNLSQLDLQLAPHLNWLIGPNGSGKTSFLEGVHLLCTGRSFRTSKLNHLINREQPRLECFGEFSGGDMPGFTLGVAKTGRGSAKYRIDKEPCSSRADYIKMSCCSVIAPDSVQLVLGSSEGRRQLIDSGVFHVKHSTLDPVQRYTRALKQRNSALKQGIPGSIRKAWDMDCIRYGEAIEANRRSFFEHFEVVFQRFIGELCPSWAIQLVWNRGWLNDITLADAFLAALRKDSILGYTSVGPHRADFSILSNGIPVNEVMSRGQIKLLTVLLTLAQVSIQHQLTQRKNIILIDDLAAEFDEQYFKMVLHFLQQQGHQLIITGLNEELVPADADTSELSMFHVKHGEISSCLSTV